MEGQQAEASIPVEDEEISTIRLAKREQSFAIRSEAQTESEIRLLGLNTEEKTQAPLKRIKHEGKALIWNVRGYQFSRYPATSNFTKYVVCEKCVLDGNFAQAEINYGVAKTTSAPTQHLKAHHHEAYNSMMGFSAKTDLENIKQTYSTEKKSIADQLGCVTKQEWMVPLCKLVVNKYLPLNFVEDPDFRDFVYKLQPRAQMPSKPTFYGELLKRRHEMTVVIEDIFRGVDQAITTDNWTSLAHQTYSSITRHGIDKNWELHSISLDCILHHGTTKGEDIKESVQRNCAELGIDPSACITDCEPSMVAAGRDFPFQHGGCVDHRIEISTGNILKSFHVCF
jgi:hypothetical protein